MQVRDIMDILLKCNHNGFPVFEDPPLDPLWDPLAQPPPPVFAGFILRSAVLYVLSTRKAFQVSSCLLMGIYVN
jgi:hypothetical protein